jgi:hypothetical protein
MTLDAFAASTETRSLRSFHRWGPTLRGRDVVEIDEIVEVGVALGPIPANIRGLSPHRLVFSRLN